MKGIILAGGKATRLRPSTLILAKGLLPIYDKPMIFYSISLLIESGIDEIYIICSPKNYQLYSDLAGNLFDDKLVKIKVVKEEKMRGPAYALKTVQTEIGSDDIALMFEDNLFVSSSLPSKIKRAKRNLNGVVIFAKEVDDPTRFGVIETDKKHNIISIEEKPLQPKSNLVTTGLMLYSNDVFAKIDMLTPSKRGEYETTDLNNLYLKEKRAKVCILNRNCKWLDTGTHTSLLEASWYVMQYQQKHGVCGSPEMSLFMSGKITKEDLLKMTGHYPVDYRNCIAKRLEKETLKNKNLSK